MSSALDESFSRVRDALAWRIRGVVGDARVDRFIVAVAKRWRPFLKKPAFIGIAGSAGKTTTKELLVGILAYRQVGVGTLQSLNAVPEVAKVVLRVRLNHDYCVAEISEDRPGAMDPVLSLLEPSIGIVTVIKDDHLASFTSREELFAEMKKLVSVLPAHGTAILNADDENVLAMRAVCNARVITYGTSSKADLRAEEISSIWPDRLQLTLVRGSERVRAKTQLCGTHWVPSVLGAIGGGLASGMTLQDCATAITKVEPFEGRMQPVTTRDGVTFIRDDFKAPLWTLDACFNFMREAKAKRKIIVIGELSDIESKKEKKYAKSASLAQQIADITIFVGPWASSVLRTRDPANKNTLFVFAQVSTAASFLNSITCEGDLILLKGSVKQDHLQRIILARSNSISCWRDDCQRNMFCSNCPNQRVSSGSPATTGIIESSLTATKATQRYVPLDANEQVIIGLGNPGDQFYNTPHNVGYAVVDSIALSMDLDWLNFSYARIARGHYEGQAFCLVKISTSMNVIGPDLKTLSESLNFGSKQCVLVFDDLDLPLGVVRTKKGGSAGGHRGVASILEAFQTDAFRRIKVGVRPQTSGVNRVDYVLTAFSLIDREVIDAAVETAKCQVLNEFKEL
jgi:aminoacyl-tRNA hydrolase